MRNEEKKLADHNGCCWGHFSNYPFFYFTWRSSNCNLTVDGGINGNRFYKCCIQCYYGHPIKIRQKFWNLRFCCPHVHFNWFRWSSWMHYWRFSYSIFSSKVVLVGFCIRRTPSRNYGIISYKIIWRRCHINYNRLWHLNLPGRLWIRNQKSWNCIR